MIPSRQLAKKKKKKTTTTDAQRFIHLRIGPNTYYTDILVKQGLSGEPRWLACRVLAHVRVTFACNHLDPSGVSSCSHQLTTALSLNLLYFLFT